MDNLRDIRVLYAREIRSALRERTIIVNGILIPIFLYPLLLWAIFSVMLFVEGLAEGFDSRVALPEEITAPELVLALSSSDGIEVQMRADQHAPRARLEAGDLDAIVLVGPATGAAAALPDNRQVRVLYNRAQERSRRALARVESVVDSLRNDRLASEARTLGVDTTNLRGYRILPVNVATERETGRTLLSVMVPFFLTVMVALGCFIPAVDTTAGERERETWETLWTTGPSRGAIVLSKYFFVATMGTVAGVLNVVAVSASLGGVLTPLMGSRAEDLAFAFPTSAIPVMLAGAVLLALLFAAVMMVLAVFARTFKEGQAMVTPAYWLALVPLVLGSSPDRTLTTALALVPVANVAMAARDAIQARISVDLVVVAFCVNAALVVACLILANRLVNREEVVTGAFEGSLWSWLRSRRRRSASGAS
jgi:sodium transport system permease protein